ncbi:DUF29 domain-containing protein [Pseudanabaena sp. UWO310]|uniref:DUF29 domain-containing protein n=1 Tax=Pseudanabaena sp. UWO310 TaxID=2480795 RepID=UPI00115BB0D7|nr:DUF29 domain-containing protein [Pseudanabaena sp. UWO310]TYQ27927.1 DUF29 domain-containing protein [Pseudanabaena sp. UWO310]
MTQAIAPPLNLYESDLDLWLETTIAQLKAGDFYNLDIENLIEELEGLSGSNKREVETRLKRLIEHILKRCYVGMPDCYRGWLLTIFEQRDELKTLLRQSPSLKRHFVKMFDDCFETSLKRIRIEYPDYQFPDTWQFERDIDTILNASFWE